MAGMSQLRRAVHAHGGTVSGGLNGRTWGYNLDAPPGKVWAATGDTHTLALEWRDGDQAWRRDAIEDALERVGLGVADCGDPECEYCHPEGAGDA